MTKSKKITESLRQLKTEVINSEHLDTQTKTLINQINIINTQSHSEKITQKQLKLAIKKNSIDTNITTFVTMNNKERIVHMLHIMKVFKSVNRNLVEQQQQHQRQQQQEQSNNSCILMCVC